MKPYDFGSKEHLRALKEIERASKPSSMRLRVLGGRPEITHGMKYGGSRYHYLHGIFVDEVYPARGAFAGELLGKPVYHVAQAGYGKIGLAGSLKEAERMGARRVMAEMREKRPRHSRTR